MAIGHLLQKAEGVIFKDHQLINPLNRLCGFNENDESMIGVDVKMINQAVQMRERGNSNVVPYDQVLKVGNSSYFLHIRKEDKVMKLACSKSEFESGLRDAGDTDVTDLSSFNLDDEYTDASEGGGWPYMRDDLIAFLRLMKSERGKLNKSKNKKKKRVRNHRSQADVSNSNNQTTTSNSTTRPFTPATASHTTTTTTPTNPSPSTKSPVPKRGKKLSNNLSASNIGSGIAPSQEGESNNSQRVESVLMSGDSNQLNIYDDNGNIRNEIIEAIQKDSKYTLLSSEGGRDKRVDGAVKHLAPRFKGTAGEWNNTSSKSKTSATIRNDAASIERLLGTLTKNDPKRAAAAITRVLNQPNCNAIRDSVTKEFRKEADAETELSKVVLDGIKSSIEHHTNSDGGTRTTPAETFVKNNVLGCVWNTVERQDITHSSLASLLGTTPNQIKKARATARDLIEKNEQVVGLKRKTRKDFIRDVLVPKLYLWLLDDEVTRFDSNQTHVEINDPNNPNQKIKVHQRIWRQTNKEQQYKDFIASKYYTDFMEENDDATGVGYTVFRDCLSNFGKFVTNPKPESCVDSLTSGMEHSMEAMLDVLRKNDVKEVLSDWTAEEGEVSVDKLKEVLRLRSSHKLVNMVCCQMVDQPDLHIEKDKPCPKMIPLKCTHGEDVQVEEETQTKKGKVKRRKKTIRERCKCCGVEKRLGTIFNRLKGNDAIASTSVTVMVWEDARRQGEKNGKMNTQNELTSKVMTVAELIEHFKKQLEYCIPHIQEIRWIKHLQDTDFARMEKDTILIFTDFAAMMVLRAREAKNSSVDAHAVIANFVVLWNKRKVKVKKKKGGGDKADRTDEEEVTISDVDIYHFFAETFDKGKQHDHQMHNRCLDEIILKYRAKLRALGIELKRVIVWTDNAPHQYRCRQTFIKLASIVLRHPGIEIVHRLAVVDNFKGIHDAVGKDPSLVVRHLESMNIRSPTAFKVFVNCIQHLETLETKWSKFETEKDSRLKDKGRFGINSRQMYYVVGKKEDLDRLDGQYPGRILHCDRSVIQDTTTASAIKGTTNFHEVRSFDKTLPESFEDVANAKTKERGQVRKWRVVTSYLPCNCVHCIGRSRPSLEAVTTEGKSIRVSVTQEETNVENPLCKYLPWRKSKIDVMIGAVALEPKTQSSLSAEQYQASQRGIVSVGESPVTSTDIDVELASDISNLHVSPIPNSDNAPITEMEAEQLQLEVLQHSVEGLSEEDKSRLTSFRLQLYSDASSIEALQMLRPDDRARVVRLLQSDRDLQFNSKYNVKNESLKRLCEKRWLDDAVISGFIMNYLVQQIDQDSFFYNSFFMSQLLFTGKDGKGSPTYTYENVLDTVMHHP